MRSGFYAADTQMGSCMSLRSSQQALLACGDTKASNCSRHIVPWSYLSHRMTCSTMQIFDNASVVVELMNIAAADPFSVQSNWYFVAGSPRSCVSDWILCLLYCPRCCVYCKIYFLNSMTLGEEYKPISHVVLYCCHWPIYAWGGSLYTPRYRIT